ncbi:MAG: endo-1,4-beta-xylanase [Spirochaeta sp.]
MSCATGAQDGQQEGATKPIIVEAESGEVGSEFEILTDQENEVEYISISTDYNETSGAAGYPGRRRMVTYTVTFPQAGTYDLYVRLRVGPADYDDDSFFIGNGFGEFYHAQENDWLVMNGFAAGGFSEPGELVQGSGVEGNGVWKWLNISKNVYQSAPPIQFTVEPDNLEVTFQIGGRENGLDIDKFAFAREDLLFTVEALDKGLEGMTEPAAEEAVTATPPDVTYEPIARDADKFLGNIYSSSQLPGFTEYWNQVTPENAGKWGSVEPTRDEMNWAQLDNAYSLAKDNGYPFRFHVLIWGNQQPRWMDDLPAEEQLEEIREWFTLVAERYPDIDYLEVVNEPLHDPPDSPGEGNYMEALGGEGETGWDWVVTSFTLAREIFPDTTLMINDYGILGNASNAQRYLELIEILQERDLIDAVGMQGHAFSLVSNSDSISGSLETVSQAELPIQITEMDIDGLTDAQQLAEYQRVFPIFWDHPLVEGITLWGWKVGMWRTGHKAYLMEENGAERPALTWLREYVEGQ